MLIIPPLIPPSDRGHEQVVSVGGTYSSAGAPITTVKCPLITWRLIAEGACYDVQKLAQGAGPPEWQEGVGRLYGETFGVGLREMATRCIKHQLELCEGAEYPPDYETRLRARLAELEGH